MSDPPARKTYWTVEQLSKRWEISPRTVRRLIESGNLRALRIGGQLRLASDTLERFEQRNEVRGRGPSSLSASGKR